LPSVENAHDWRAPPIWVHARNARNALLQSQFMLQSEIAIVQLDCTHMTHAPASPASMDSPKPTEAGTPSPTAQPTGAVNM